MDLVWENEDCSVHFSEYKTAFLHYHGPVTEPSFRVCFSRFQRVQGGGTDIAIAIAGESRTVPRSRFPEWDDLLVCLNNAGFPDDPAFITHLKESIISRAKSIAQDRDQEPLINVVLRVYTANEEAVESCPPEMMMMSGARTEESESDQEYNYSDDDDYDQAEYSDVDLDHGLMVQENVVKKMVSPEAMEGWRNKVLDEVESEACCVICFQNLGRVVKATPCGHYYHQSCIFQWLNTSSACPLCRCQFVIN